jgi:hypothetical protein
MSRLIALFSLRKKLPLMISGMYLLLLGCVGTVEDAKQEYTKINEAGKVALQFAGVTSTVAISDSRIEVFFYPAQGGSGLYTYDILVSGQTEPISLPSDILQPDYRGLLRYTITGLERLTTYLIKVEVRDKETEVQSTSGVMKTVTTFDNLVSDFDGIANASNTPGQDGKDSFKIRWTPARESSGLSKQSWDPVSYEIVVVDADRLTPNDMDVTTLGPENGRWVFGLTHNSSQNEYIVRGLPSSKKFYVRMRSIHLSSVNDVYNPKKRSELNTKYVSISTLSSQLADLNFNPQSFTVALSSGEQGLNALMTSWTSALGVFDHYRIYYSEQDGGAASGNLPDLCLSPLNSPATATVWCKKMDFKLTATPITGLKPYTNYEVVLVVCATTACRDGERLLTPVRTILTDPSLPAFNGISTLVTAKSLQELGTIKINYQPPNFSTGYFDGLMIKMRRTTDGSDQEVDVTQTSSPVYHQQYNFLADNSVVLDGINYLAVEPFCFAMFPFKWETDGLTKREFRENVTWRCTSPIIDPPTALEFKGVDSATTSGSSITLNWTAPTAGIFSHYEIYYTKISGTSLIWGDAIDQAGKNFNQTNYGMIPVDKEKTSHTIANIPDGSFSIGIITYFNYISSEGAVIKRSETNVGILSCSVNSSSTTAVNCTAN